MAITDLTLITVTGHYLMTDGTNAVGTITFRASSVLLNTVSNEVVYPSPIVVPLVAGAFSVPLPATNDPDLSPVGWTYEVTENILGSLSTRTFSMSVPYNGGALDIADVVPTSVVGVASSYIVIAGHANNSVPVSISGSLADLSMGASTVLARLASGGVVAATPAQLATLLESELDATYAGVPVGGTPATAVIVNGLQSGTVGSPGSDYHWKFQPVRSDYGPFVSWFQPATFSGNTEVFWKQGYNADLSKAGEPALFWSIHNDASDAPGQHNREISFHYIKPDHGSPEIIPFQILCDGISNVAPSVALVFHHGKAALDGISFKDDLEAPYLTMTRGVGSIFAKATTFQAGVSVTGGAANFGLADWYRTSDNNVVMSLEGASGGRLRLLNNQTLSIELITASTAIPVLISKGGVGPVFTVTHAGNLVMAGSLTVALTAQVYSLAATTGGIDVIGGLVNKGVATFNRTSDSLPILSLEDPGRLRLLNDQRLSIELPGGSTQVPLLITKGGVTQFSVSNAGNVAVTGSLTSVATVTAQAFAGTAEIYLQTPSSANAVIVQPGFVTKATFATAAVTLADAYNIAVGTTTGTKIGTSTAHKLAFWNATPVVQPSGIADVSGGAIIDAEARTAFNSLLAKLETIGLLAVA